MPENVNQFRAGTRVSASHLNQIVRAVSTKLASDGSIKIQEQAGLIYLTTQNFKGWWVGEINAAGKTDYSDANYYVKQQKLVSVDVPNMAGSDLSDLYFPSDFIHTALNLDELTDGTHSLSDGMGVVVFEMEDNSVPPVSRYFMSKSPNDGTGVNTDEYVKTNDSDTTAGHLTDKLKVQTAGAGAAAITGVDEWIIGKVLPVGADDNALYPNHADNQTPTRVITFAGDGTYITGGDTLSFDAKGHESDATKTITMTGSGAVADNSHNLLSAPHTDTDPSAATKGDIIFATGATPSVWDDLPISSDTGDVLTVSAAGLPAWEAIPDSWPTSDATSKIVGSDVEGGSDASSTTWQSQTGSDCYLYMCSRVTYDDTSGNPTLFGFSRRLSFDVKGRLYNVGAETRYTIDIPSDCD